MAKIPRLRQHSLQWFLALLSVVSLSSVLMKQPVSRVLINGPSVEEASRNVVARKASRRSEKEVLPRPSPLDSKIAMDSILMISYVFGEEAANRKYLQLFAESALHSGINIAIVGHPIPSFAPLFQNTNVKFVDIPWDALVDRVRDRVLDGKEPVRLRQATQFYKINDFKPLVAELFPELVGGYDWWGYLDNDMVLGDLRRFLNRRKLAKYDIIAGYPSEYTSGPFMLYRNRPETINMFRLAERPLEEIFDTEQPLMFDEWGGGTDRAAGLWYNSTMAGIVERHHKHLGLRWFGGIASIWDGFCMGKMDVSPCTHCMLSVELGLRNKKQKMYEVSPAEPMLKRREIGFCHFQYSKHIIEESLSENNSRRLALSSSVLIRFRSGLQLVNEHSQ